MSRMARIGMILGGIVLLASAVAMGQQATVATPYHAVGDRYFENVGTRWAVHGNGFDLRFGNPNGAAPPFGRLQPAAGATVGMGFRRHGLSGSFQGNFSQGSQQSLVSQTPCLTVTDGVPGYLAVGTMSPFVVSYVPVVGGFAAIPAVCFPMPVPEPVMPSPADALPAAMGARPAVVPGVVVERVPLAQDDNDVQDDQDPPAEAAPEGIASDSQPTGAADRLSRRLARAQQSTAGRPVPSVREARRMRAAEEAALQTEAQVYYERGLSAEEAGNLGAAKVYYQMASRRAAGKLQDDVQRRLDVMKRAGK